jgi:hypothetical protein
VTEAKLNRVLDYLQNVGSASKKEIRRATYYDNAGDAIRKLRERGHNIQTTWERSSTGARYAVYVYLGKVEVSA